MERVNGGVTRLVCVPERASEPPRPAPAAENPSPETCPLCGALRLFPLLERAARTASVAAKDLLVVSCLGCSLDWSGLWKPYGFRCGSGGALATALGAALANPELTVVAFDEAAALCDADLLRRAAAARLICCALESRGAGAAPLAAALAAAPALAARFPGADRALLIRLLARAMKVPGLCWLQISDEPVSRPKGDAGLAAWGDRAAALRAVGAWEGAGPLGVFEDPAPAPLPDPGRSPIKSRLALTKMERDDVLKSLL